MKQLICSLNIVLVVMMGFSDALWAQPHDTRVVECFQPLYLASSQWISGTVETVGTEAKHKYVRINGIQYRLMPEVAIARRVSRGKDAFNEVPASFKDVRENMEVMLRVQGFRIYQILIME